ncbi:MAG: GH92 family glycosyl hydrolase, partial [Bacteroidetes bacterium]|nr:GH92 family glycosyl hydrolase [Bacteroidota bacterium]
MRHVYSWLLAVLCGVGVVGAGHAQEPNDHIFPETAGASRSIHFDKNGFFIHGRRTFIVSAGMEYARVPRALWADRLLRLQRAGFNCVEVYAFWNFHEPREGVFEFGGDRDLGEFLRLVRRMGMYAIVRVGPYDCAEWENGGYPLWLKFKPGLRVREHNAVFETYVGRFFDRVLPIVAANQIYRGGCVIMVQLENEHPLGWGTDKPNGYFDFLQRKALELGIGVPYFFSGLHHSSDPAGDAVSLDEPGRPNPWFTTEFWSVWYNGYGSGPREARLFEDRTWKIIQRGGGGYNYYMAHGGSNFGYTNNDEDAASYDYGAAVGQAGDLRPIYYGFKRAALFARSFASELAERRVHFSDSGVAVDGYVRVSGDSAMLLARCGSGLVVYGKAGSLLGLRFEGGERVSVRVPGGMLPDEHIVGSVRVLVMNLEATDRCWVIGDTIVCGPKYVGRVRVEGGEIEMEVEDPGDRVHAVVYTAERVARLFSAGSPVRPGSPVLSATVGGWKKTLMTGPVQQGFDDHAWVFAQRPLQMGADGDSTAEAWYRTFVTAENDGDYTLLVEGADRGLAFLDGRPLGAVDVRSGAIPLRLTKGRHMLAVFTAHDGRDKLAAYIGGLDSVARKGLFGRALLVKGPPAVRTLDGWRVLKDGVFKTYKIGDDVFDKKAGKAWFETELPDVAPGVRQAELRFASVDENADVYINDRKVFRHEGWNSPFDVLLDRIDTMRRPVKLKVFIENYSNEGGIDQPVRFSPWASPVEVRGWRMKGGLGVPGSAAGPCIWKAEFTVPANPGFVSIWRVKPEGLGHGSVWVNGHNLGRYPEKIPVNGLYIPECWLRPGQNRLEIFDEEGRDVSRVRIELEEAASRRVTTLKEGMADDLARWVDPFIGTAKSDVFTRWGNEGGTYPGAVAPWGYLQLTPETRLNGGYDYGDSVIRVFSCMHHPSGFPNGSAGRFFVMPFRGGVARPFSHKDEVAEPGYYRVRLSDDGTLVEMVADTLAGLFRMTFPGGVEPEIFVGDTAGMSFGFSQRYIARRAVQGGEVFSFAADAGPVLVWIGAEGGDFESLRGSVREEWNRVLSVVDVQEGGVRDKTIFYTALYHSLLVPWVLPAGGYGSFSPWDSYRSLHPLLTLLYPDRQAAMMRAMMEVYRRQGHLPVESMTGNHAVAILADAYLKGVRAVDAGMAYGAMMKSLVRGPFQQDDREVYADSGYIPMTGPESVTRTVEYAYDDWVLGQYARSVMGDAKTAEMLERRSAAWRRLLYVPSLLLLPRVGDSFRVRPGNAGYKEGDAWVYSYFAPQDVSGMIDRMGGDREFALRLDSALKDRRIVFDNETVLHVPYLFNFAGRHDLAIYWINEIMRHRYSDRPGGLPGNDDLGAMSSWYVFSALGFFPWCPGRPDYAVGTPLFGKVVLHLAGGKDLVIRRGRGPMTVSHRMITAGGELVLGDGVEKVRRARPEFVLSGMRLGAARVRSGDSDVVHFFVENKGVTGVKIVRLFVGGRVAGIVNCFVNAGQRVGDSIRFCWYPSGDFRVRLDGVDVGVLAVAPGALLPSQPAVGDPDMRVIVRMGDTVSVVYPVQNTGWKKDSYRLPIIVDDSVVAIDPVVLEAGEQKVRKISLAGARVGWHQLWIGKRVQRYRVCDSPGTALVLDLDSNWKDRSGFGNDGVVMDGLVRMPASPSLNDLGRRLTMVLWVCPEGRRRGLTDIFTNGDNHVLQVVDGRQLTFFAGGWGRGDCTVDLPSDWEGRWHLIAGVCDDSGLRVYIDGVRCGATP